MYTIKIKRLFNVKIMLYKTQLDYSYTVGNTVIKNG